MHQNVSLRYVGFERRHPTRPPVSSFAGRPSLSITPRVHESRSSTLSSPARLSQTPPGCLLVSQKSLLTFLVFGFRSGTQHCFAIRSEAETWQVSMETTFVQMFPVLWKFRKDLSCISLFIFFGGDVCRGSKVIFHRAAIPFGGGKARIASIIGLNMRPNGR